MMKDLTILAKDAIFDIDPDVTGINKNELIVGSTGSGKTFSTVLPRILNTYNSSLVIPLSKPYIYNLTADKLRSRGYDIQYISFINPANSTVSYDPLDYVLTDEDAMTLANNIIYGDSKPSSKADPFWDESAVTLLGSLIQLVRLNSKHANSKPKFSSVIDLMERVVGPDSYALQLFSSPLTIYFDEAERLYPGNHASRLWRSFSSLSVRTISCIYTEANVRLSMFATETLYNSMKQHPKLDIHKLGEKRTALFIETSVQNTSLERFTNLLYADIFRVLFQDAQKSPDLTLKNSVHIIFDDFACGSKIHNFDKQISIFRAAGISVTLLLQSESQLASIYGPAEASTIINNCDTYAFFGSADFNTCQTVSLRLNCPVQKILNSRLNRVIVFRRGMDPIDSYRYPILEDIEYKQLQAILNNKQKENVQ